MITVVETENNIRSKLNPKSSTLIYNYGSIMWMVR